jgi:cell division protein FtsB
VRGALWVTVAALVLAIGYLGVSTYKVYSRMVEVEKLRVAAESERDALRTRNTELSASLRALETGRGVEAEIRSRYPLVKPGEVEFVLPGVDTSAVDTSSSTRDSIWATLRAFVGL